MPFFSGGGGGAAFAGGTIHAGLDIEPTATDTEVLKLVAPQGQSVPVLDVTSSAAGVDYRLLINSAGSLSFTDIGGVTALHVNGSSHAVTLAESLLVEPDIGVMIIDSGGGPYPSLGTSVFYYNGTTGYLQVEAQKGNGTAIHGSIPLRQGSGALPTVALVSGTGAQIDATSNRETITPVTFNPGAATTATCTVALSPDNTTYSTLGVETVPAGVALDGTIHLVQAHVPIGYYLKLTVNAQATLGTTTYY